MTVKELKELIDGLPEDMVVMMPFHEEGLITVYKSKSKVEEIVIEIGEEDSGDMIEEDILVLHPCDCNIEEELAIQDMTKEDVLN